MSAHATDIELDLDEPTLIIPAPEDGSLMESSTLERLDVVTSSSTRVPRIPASRWPPAKSWLQLAAQIESKITQNWVPHAFSQREIRDYRVLTQKFISVIKVMEEHQTRIGGQMVDLRVDQALFTKRMEYRTTFYRLFRINDLPVEIINNIFSFVCWQAPDSQSGIKWRLYLTSICRHWRTVAINHATLWNAIWMTDGPLFQQSLTWLDRAGRSDIDIRLNDTPQKPLTLEGTQRLVQHIIPKISHIRSFVMVAQDWDPILCIIDAFRRVAEERLPMIIRTFEVHRGGSVYVQLGTGYQPSFYTQPMPLFGGAIVPSLRHVACNGVHFDWDKSHLSDLLTFDIRRMPLDKTPTLTQFRSILQNSPEMEKLLLDGAGPQHPQNAEVAKNLQPIPLPKLRFLILGDFHVNFALYTLSQITCSGVIDLTLMDLFGEDLSPFFDLLNEKVTSVQSLTLLVTRQLSPLSIESIVKWLHSLNELYFLRISGIHKTFFDLFLYNPETMLPANGPSEPTLCPKLTYLEVHSMDTDFLPDWVEKRVSFESPLKKIYIGEILYKTLSKENLEKLAKLRERHKNLTLCTLSRHQKAPEDIS